MHEGTLRRTGRDCWGGERQLLTERFCDVTPFLVVENGRGTGEKVGEAVIAESANGVFDALLPRVPPDGHGQEVLLEVGDGLLTSEERGEGARGVHRWRRRAALARSVGRGTLEVSRRPRIAKPDVAGERGRR